MSRHLQISVIGLGKLGSCLAAVLANKKNQVRGIDINRNIIKSIKSKKSPFEEKGLAELLKKSGTYLAVDSQAKKNIAASEVIFLVVPTPSKADGTFSLQYILNAIPEIAAGIKENIHPYPVLVLTSTVMPGDCEKHIIPLLEKQSTLKCGSDFGFCYNPEFIALGNVINDIQNPDMILIGQSDEKAGKKLRKVYKTFIENNPAYELTNIINAEIIKLSINTFVTTKISYANMLTQVCSKIKGANIDVVTSALGKDSRIGAKYLTGGTSYGGPCFPRDNKAFVKMASGISINAHLAKATDQTNSDHLRFICRQIYKLAGPGQKIGILGLSYKPETPVVEESSGIRISEMLIKKNYTVSYYDPLVTKSGIPALKRNTSMLRLLKWADVIILLSNDKYYKNIKSSELKPGAIILDCWRILDKQWADYPGWYPLGISK